MTEFEQACLRELELLSLSFTRLADNIGRVAAVMEERLIIDHPPKKEGKDATVTHIKTDEEKILEDQGYERGELGRWLDIGERERAFTEAAKHPGVPGDPIPSRTRKTWD